MATIIPDLNWYSTISKDKGVTARCPFATVQTCPRYYQSLSLLGRAGSTSINPREDKRLLKKWSKSDLWPRTDEYATSISGPGEEKRTFSNFCPEVSFDRFGYFATFLARYADEIDAGTRHRFLREEGAPSEHWGWAWQYLTPMHYTECPIYAPLHQRALAKEQEPWYKKYLIEIIIGIIITVVGGLILALFI